MNLEGALTWACEFEDQPYFAGFRALATNGVDLPVLNVFRMLALMKDRRLAVSSDGAVPLDAILKDGVRGRPDVSALAGRADRSVTVLTWRDHDDDVAGPEAEVQVSIDGLPTGIGRARLRVYRLDTEHGNAYTVWLRMGSDSVPSPAQYAALERAGQLAEATGPGTIAVENGRATLPLTLPRQSVVLVVVDW